jgi:3-hydroxybutyryl-CoA dehydrogenase
MNVEDIQKVTVIGAGLMGHGIALEFALGGYEVYVHDVSQEKLDQARETIKNTLQMLVRSGLATAEQSDVATSRLHTGTVLEEVAADVDVVIEAVFENLELKQELFGKLDGICPERTVLASNSSSLMPSQLAPATARPDKVLIAHYFNPPYLLPLVEIVPGKETSDETVKVIQDLLIKVGKKPVIVKKEALGFIGNRLQFALGREALSIVQKGIATPEDVDTVIKNGFGRRLSVAGLFEIFDIAGLDLGLAVASYIGPDLESSTEGSPLLKEKVERGELGVKTGKGFREWTPESAEASRKKIAKALIEIARWSS